MMGIRLIVIIIIVRIMVVVVMMVFMDCTGIEANVGKNSTDRQKECGPTESQ